MRAVAADVGDRLRVEAVLVELVVEHLGDDDLGGDVLAGAVRAVWVASHFGKPRGIGEARRIEERVARVDARVDDPDLDAAPGVGAAAGGRPTRRRR